MILRLPKVEEEGVRVDSFGFVIAEGHVAVFDRKENRLESLGKLDALAHFLDRDIDTLVKEIQRYHFDIDLMEESLYSEKISEEFMQEWLRYKKDVSLIHRVMFHATLAFELFVAFCKKQEVADILPFADILEHMGRVRDLAKSAMEKLDNLYDFYRAKVDERMNKNVYYLTIISGVFLPLTLITGFFGMNTGGLPWVEDPNGTLKAVVFAGILEIIMIIPFFIQNSKRIKKFQRGRKKRPF